MLVMWDKPTKYMLDLIGELQKEIKKGPLASVIRLLDLLLSSAYKAGASDIHIDPTAHEMIVRWRVDGILFRVGMLPHALREEFIARIKIISGLRTDIRMMSQDGRVQVETEWVDVPIDVRLSIIPTQHGENVVMRILPKEKNAKTFLELGFTPEQATVLTTACLLPQGLIIIAGPTGSGKTTTVYSMLHVIDRETLSVITVEDPIEYSIDNARQIQVNAGIDFTFATALRSILRQDPDVIMVGEIRDAETMNIALGAALTGHLVITTLHANDALSTISRLRAMGVDPHILSMTLTHVVSQRLVRKICTYCRTSGCERCLKSGYHGRLTVSETLSVDKEVRTAIADGVSVDDVRSMVAEKGFITLYQDGKQKIHQGLTTDAELGRVCRATN